MGTAHLQGLALEIQLGRCGLLSRGVVSSVMHQGSLWEVRTMPYGKSIAWSGALIWDIIDIFKKAICTKLSADLAGLGQGNPRQRGKHNPKPRGWRSIQGFAKVSGCLKIEPKAQGWRGRRLSGARSQKAISAMLGHLAFLKSQVWCEGIIPPDLNVISSRQPLWAHHEGWIGREED